MHQIKNVFVKEHGISIQFDVPVTCFTKTVQANIGSFSQSNKD